MWRTTYDRQRYWSTLASMWPTSCYRCRGAQILGSYHSVSAREWLAIGIEDPCQCRLWGSQFRLLEFRFVVGSGRSQFTFDEQQPYTQQNQRILCGYLLGTDHSKVVLANRLPRCPSLLLHHPLFQLPASPVLARATRIKNSYHGSLSQSALHP